MLFVIFPPGRSTSIVLLYVRPLDKPLVYCTIELFNPTGGFWSAADRLSIQAPNINVVVPFARTSSPPKPYRILECKNNTLSMMGSTGMRLDGQALITF